MQSGACKIISKLACTGYLSQRWVLGESLFECETKPRNCLVVRGPGISPEPYCQREAPECQPKSERSAWRISDLECDMFVQDGSSPGPRELPTSLKNTATCSCFLVAFFVPGFGGFLSITAVTAA